MSIFGKLAIFILGISFFALSLAQTSSISVDKVELERPELERDLNGANFINDNVKEYITNLPDTDKQRTALFQYAGALQSTINRKFDNNLDLEKTRLQIFSSLLCLRYRYYPVNDELEFNNTKREIENRVIDTLEKKNLYIDYLEQSSNLPQPHPHSFGCHSIEY